MESPTSAAPPVVAVVVAHDPGTWFEAVLDSLAAQDYPNLKVLILDTGTSDDIQRRVEARLPEAFVRRREGLSSYGETANETMKLVEGGGFFCFLHDDVALEAGAIRLLVEELYRSNAGIVGPKLVEWDDPDVLLSVGLGADKFGELAPAAAAGELDQEQHDGVRDTFCLPAVCLLVRADLFRALGGFDPVMRYHGDDLDLCWRAHLSGARVLVVPAARARHRRSRFERQPDVEGFRLAARHRLRTVLSNYSVGHLLRVLPQMVVVTILEALVKLVTGQPAKAAALFGAWGWNAAQIGTIIERRRGVAAVRQVPDSDVRRLQVRGSAALATFLKSRSARRDERRLSAMADAGRTLFDNVREGTHWPTIGLWGAVIGFFLLGSRELVRGRIPAAGQFLAVPDHPAQLARQYLSGWWQHGLGTSAPMPTGIALVGLVGWVVRRPGLLRTVAVLAPVALGYLGMWRLTRPLVEQRARLLGLVVYAAVPLPYNAIASGHLGGLLCYGALPWAVLRLARMSALAPFGSTDGAAGPGLRHRSLAAEVAGLAVLTAVVAAFVPWFALLVGGIAVAFLLASVVVGGIGGSARAAAGALVAVALAIVLHLPWSAHLLGQGWAGMSDPPLAGPVDHGLSALARFATGPFGSNPFAYVFGVAGFVALVIGRQWRLAWAARAMFAAMGFLALALAADRGALPFDTPSIEVLLAPVAIGFALAAACAGAAFESDVRGTRLTWRQPLSLLAVATVMAAAVPTLGAAAAGRWGLGHSDLTRTLELMPSRSRDGGYRILWLGDPRALPQPGWPLVDGLAYALSQDGAPDVTALWADHPTTSDQLVAQALALSAGGRSNRLGRMIGPMGVRFIVVARSNAPAVDGRATYALPPDLVGALSSQLDLREIGTGDDAVTVYENVSWIATRAVLSGGAKAASDKAGWETLVRTDLSESVAALDSDGPNRYSGPIGPGALYLSQRSDPHWQLTVDGRRVASRPAFGWATAFDAPGGSAQLRYATPLSRRLLVIAQIVAWIIALRVAWAGLAVPRLSRRRRSSYEGHDVPQPIIHLDPDLMEQRPVAVAAAVTSEAQFSEFLFSSVDETAASRSGDAPSGDAPLQGLVWASERQLDDEESS